jgi:hypothetical protein
VSSSRRRLVPALALGVTAAAAVTALVLGPLQDEPPVAGNQPTAPAPVGGSSPGADPTPAGGVTTSQKSASCVSVNSAEALKQQTLAFDGTVVSAVPTPDAGPAAHTVTLTVNQWFKGPGGRQVKVIAWAGPQNVKPWVMTSVGPEYSIGSRLLVSGRSISGGPDPLKRPVMSGCRLTLPYTAADAATWQKVFGK